MSGFTILELMITFMLMVLVIGISFSMYIFFQKSIIPIESRLDVENASLRAINRITYGVYDLVRIDYYDSTRIIFIRPNGSTVDISYKENALYRNNVKLNKWGVMVDSFNIVLLTNNSQLTDAMESQDESNVKNGRVDLDATYTLTALSFYARFRKNKRIAEVQRLVSLRNYPLMKQRSNE